MSSTPDIEPPKPSVLSSKLTGPVKKKPPAPTLPPPAFSFKVASMDIILEDLSSRFILNLPDNELSSVERVCFQVEQAHWYYEDFIRLENPSLPSMALRSFSAKLFAACPLLQRWSYRHEEAFADFVKYKTSVPVCGAILLNSTWDKCVLVKGWKSSAPWGFPRGKINENEPLHTCAAREVLEETGYNCGDELLQDAFITLQGKDQQFVTLYVVPNVPEDYPFNTRTRKEISKIDWFFLSQLPGWQSPDDDEYDHQSIRTWSVSPFLIQLQNRLLEFQLAFGYMPPNLTARQLKEIKRIKRAQGRTATNQARAGQPAGRAKNVASQSAKVRNGGDESTGAEGDEEPEAETDHDGRYLAADSSIDVAETMAPTFTPSPSAVDALFSRSVLTNPGDQNHSSPDIQGPSPLKKVVKSGKSATKSRTRTTTTTVTTQQPSDDTSALERAQFNNLMQSLVSSSGPLSSDTTAVEASSGLPTPADSPVQLSNPPQIHLDRTATATSITSTTTIKVKAMANPTSSPQPRSMFDYISPFDALAAPSSDRGKVKSTVTILKRPLAVSHSSGASSDTLASTSDSFLSRSSSEDLTIPSSGDEDEHLRIAAGPPLEQATYAEAPATLNLPPRTPGGLMRTLLPDTYNASGSPDHAVYLTPKPKQPRTMEEIDGAEAPTLSRGSSSSSAASSGHMALLDMVAHEVEALQTQSTCATPQPKRSGAMLPPVGDVSGWPVNTGQRMDLGPIGGEFLPHPTTQIPGRHMPPPMPPISNGNHYQEYTSVLPPPPFHHQLRHFPPARHVSLANPPYLHHPHPHLHPHQHISIPSASPSPSPALAPPPTLAQHHQHHEFGATMLNGDPRSGLMGQSAAMMPRFPMLGQNTGPRPMAGSPSIVQMLQGPPATLYQSPMNPMSPDGRSPGLHNLSTGPSLPPSTSVPTAGYPYIFNGKGSPASSPLSLQSGGNSHPMRSPIPVPNPNSFVVQKSQADRNELLNLIRSRSPAPPVANTPLAAAMTVAPVASPNGKVQLPPPSLPPVAAATPGSKRTSSIFESGLIPANVQFRALTKAARASNAVSSTPK